MNVVDDVRVQRINDIWKQIHGEFQSVFYWMDFTTTDYYYDSVTDSIVADNGFKVSVDLPTEKLSKDYIYDLIEKLEGDISKYYREKYNVNIY